MKRRGTALILSLIYCGLGQIYKGQVTKGVDFVIIYTLLIVFSVLSRPLALLHYLILSVTVLMWLMGMADAYMGDGSLVARGRGLLWRRLLSAVSFATISIAILTLLISHERVLSAAAERQILSVWNMPVSPGEDRVYPHKPKPPDGDTAAIVASATDEDQDEDPGSQYVQEVPIYEEDVTITAYSLRPTVAEPGATLTVEYIIDTSRDITVGLGCSIRRDGSTRWIDDPDNDKVVHVDAGGGSYSRKFTLPPAIRPGKYHVAWGVWDPDFSIPYDGRLSSNALIVTAQHATNEAQPTSSTAAHIPMAEAEKPDDLPATR